MDHIKMKLEFILFYFGKYIEMPDDALIGLAFLGFVILIVVILGVYGYKAGWFTSNSIPTPVPVQVLPVTQPTPVAQATMTAATSAVTSNPPVLPTPTSAAIVPIPLATLSYVISPVTTSGADGSLITLNSSAPMTITNATYGTANVTSIVAAKCNGISGSCGIVALPSGWTSTISQVNYVGQLGSDPQPGVAKTLTINWTGSGIGVAGSGIGVVTPSTTITPAPSSTVAPTTTPLFTIPSGACSDPEAFYLQNNPDVAANIASGTGFTSGYQHWVSNGSSEGRKSCWKSPPTCTGNSLFYRGKDYAQEGSAPLSLPPGFTKDLSLIPGGWNDQISSYQLAPGCAADLYSDANKGGWKIVGTGSNPWVGDQYNDQISSINIYGS
jgi:hypothetical protein